VELDLGSTTPGHSHTDEVRISDRGWAALDVNDAQFVSRGMFAPCLLFHPKIFDPSHQIFRHMHRTLNIDKK